MKSRTRAIIGGSLIFVGILLVGESTGLYSGDELMQALIPIAFIAGGVWLIARRKKRDAGKYPPGHGPYTPPRSSDAETGEAGVGDPYQQSQPSAETAEPSSTGISFDQPADTEPTPSGRDETKESESPESGESGKLRYRKTFGDMYIDLNGVSLQNIEISAGVGDMEIVLTGGVLSEGLNRIIISSFIGDIRIFASPDLPTFTHCSSFVGDIDVMKRRASGFGNSIDSQTANYESSSKKLYIACNNFIGDIRIYGL